jgi:hypothetical protein
LSGLVPALHGASFRRSFPRRRDRRSVVIKGCMRTAAGPVASPRRERQPVVPKGLVHSGDAEAQTIAMADANSSPR